MRKPAILISPDVALPGTAPRDRIQLNFEYQHAIADAGGIPLVASPFAAPEDLANMADGWLITGGSDMPGAMFDEPDHPNAVICHDDRLKNDKCLYETLGESEVPILGICFGMQFLAVINGGALEQDMSGHKNGAATAVTTDPDSRIARMGLSGTFSVLCYHHQAVKRVPQGWRGCATAPDGTVEAIEEASGRWRFGVQWHPERTADSPQSKALFRAFVDACR